MITTTIPTAALRMRALSVVPSTDAPVHFAADLGRSYKRNAEQGSPPRGEPR